MVHTHPNRPRSTVPFAVVVLTLAVLTGVPLAAQDARASRGTIVGVVLDDADERPLPAVVIRVLGSDLRAVTDSAGQFRLQRVPSGSHNVVLGLLGYETATEIWRVDGDTLSVFVRLAPDPIALEALQVRASRLEGQRQAMERQRRASGYSSHAWDEDELRHGAAENAADFVISRYGLISVPCGFLSTSTGPGDCLRIRGQPTRVCVVIDERPAIGGISELARYYPSEFFRLEVYQRGALIVGYTRHFVEGRAHRSRSVLPVEVKRNAFC